MSQLYSVRIFSSWHLAFFFFFWWILADKNRMENAIGYYGSNNGEEKKSLKAAVDWEDWKEICKICNNCEWKTNLRTQSHNWLTYEKMNFILKCSLNGEGEMNPAIFFGKLRIYSSMYWQLFDLSPVKLLAEKCFCWLPILSKIWSSS